MVAATQTLIIAAFTTVTMLLFITLAFQPPRDHD